MTHCFGLGKVKGVHKYETFLFNFWMFHVKLIILRGTFFSLTKIIIFMEWPDPPPFGKFHKNYNFFFETFPKSVRLPDLELLLCETESELKIVISNQK